MSDQEHPKIPGLCVAEFHPSPLDGKMVATISGVDIYEAGDGYTPSELRSIARMLELYADELTYQRYAEDTMPLFDSNSQNP